MRQVGVVAGCKEQEQFPGVFQKFAAPEKTDSDKKLSRRQLRAIGPAYCLRLTLALRPRGGGDWCCHPASETAVAAEGQSRLFACLWKRAFARFFFSFFF